METKPDETKDWKKKVDCTVCHHFVPGVPSAECFRCPVMENYKAMTEKELREEEAKTGLLSRIRIFKKK